MTDARETPDEQTIEDQRQFYPHMCRDGHEYDSTKGIYWVSGGMKYVFAMFWLSFAWSAARYVLGEGPIWLKSLALVAMAVFVVNAHCETNFHKKAE